MLSKPLSTLCLCIIMQTVMSCDIFRQVDQSMLTAQNAIQEAITKLVENSESWQSTLIALEDKLNKDAKGLLSNEVNGLMSRGIAQAGTELRCNLDFVGNRMREGLERILAVSRNEEPAPLVPFFCLVDPDVLNMGERPTHIRWYGYNFDVTDPVTVKLVDDTGETDLSQFINTPTHYLLTLDVSEGSNPPICNRDNRKLVLSWHDQVLGDMRVIPKVCPSASEAPTPHPERPLMEAIIDKRVGGLSGFRIDIPHGGGCSQGFKRSRVSVAVMQLNRNPFGGGSAHCEFLDWASGDEHDCTALIHFGGDPGTGIECRTEIFEVGEQLPQPPPPPCPCR